MSEDIRKWIDILNEGKVDLVLGLDKDIPVIRNPNNIDLENVLRKSYTKSARMTIDKNYGDVWIWGGDFHSHYDVQVNLEKLNETEMEFDARFIIVKIEYHDGDHGYAIGGDSYTFQQQEQIFNKWKNHRLFTRMFGNKEFEPVEEVESTYWSRFKDLHGEKLFNEGKKH